MRSERLNTEHLTAPQPDSSTATHWIDYDAPAVGRGRYRALCGRLVPESSHAVSPTCPDCATAIDRIARWLDAEREA
jgi:hypothetical protein